MTQADGRPTPAAAGQARTHPAFFPKPEEGGAEEEVKLEGPVSARHCSCAERLLPKLTSCIPSPPPPGTLLHGTDLNSGPQGWEQAENKATV